MTTTQTRLPGTEPEQAAPAKPKPPPPDDLPLFDLNRRQQLDLVDAIKDKVR